MTWYMKGQSDYDSANFHMGLFFDTTGFASGDYNTIVMPDDVVEGDPFLTIAAETKPTWTPGSAVVEIGLWDNYRIKISSSGIEGWDESGSEWIDLLGDVSVPDHNALNGLNDGDSYEHITQAQKTALHSIYTDANARAALGNVIGSDGHLDADLDGDGNGIVDIDRITFRTSVTAYIQLQESLGGTPSYQGMVMTVTCNNGTNYTSCMYSDTTNNRVSQCDADTIAQMPCIGLRVTSSRILLQGVVRNDSAYNFSPNGAVLYVGNNGLLTTTIPGGINDVVQIVGVVMEPDIIYFNPSLSYVVRK